MFSKTSGSITSFLNFPCLFVSFVNGSISSFEWSYFFKPGLSVSPSIILPPKLILIWFSIGFFSSFCCILASSICALLSSLCLFLLCAGDSTSSFCSFCSFAICCLLSNLSSRLSSILSIILFIISDGFIPNVNTNKIIAMPVQNIIAPTIPNNFTSATAPTAPTAPPPLLCVP